MATPEETQGVLQTSILDVIENSDVSVRLHNAIRAAAQHGGLPFETVGEYLEAGPSAASKFMRLQNLGLKSARELDILVQAFAAGGDNLVRAPMPSIEESDEERVRRLLLWQFSGLTFPSVISEYPTSVRLRNALASNPELKRPYSEFLDNPNPVLAEIFRLQNLGRTSTEELRKLIPEITSKLLQASGLSEVDSLTAVALILGRHRVEPDILLRLEAAATEHGVITEADLSAERTNNSLAMVVSALLAEVSERSKAVVERRYGIGREHSETLEEIGFSYGITRERIRQIEAKVLRQLTLPSRARRLRAALSREASRIISEAAGDAEFVTDAESWSLLRKINPCAKLAMDVAYKPKKSATIGKQFLASAVTHWRGGWLLAQQSVEELDHIVDHIHERLRVIKLPAAASEVVEATNAAMAAAALRLGTDFVVFDGYLLPGRAGPRRRRTVRLHKLLVNAGRLQELRDLISVYLKRFQGDSCSVRDAEIVMYDAPHLFLRIVDECWYSVGPAPPLENIIPSSEPPPGDDSNDVTESEDILDLGDEANIRSLLRNELLEHGPLRFVDLRNNCARRLDGKSANSIGPILITSGDFVRPLPGIYALHEQLPSSAILPFDPPRFLLMEDQARWFAMARYAGEPFGRYPLWTAEAEYALCRWSQNNASPVVFQSILAIASVNQWPVSEETRQQWRALQRKEGAYGLAQTPRYPLRQLWPPLDRVLAACVQASRDGGLTWITANRVLKRRMDAHISAGILALMVLIRALEPAPNWQLRHQNGDHLEELIDRLSAQLHRDGSLEWSSSVGSRLLGEMKSGNQGIALGWLSRDLVDDLLAGSRSGDPGELLSTGDADEPISSLEALLTERRRKKEAESIRDILNSVLRPRV